MYVVGNHSYTVRVLRRFATHRGGRRHGITAATRQRESQAIARGTSYYESAIVRARAKDELRHDRDKHYDRYRKSRSIYGRKSAVVVEFNHVGLL